MSLLDLSRFSCLGITRKFQGTCKPHTTSERKGTKGQGTGNSISFTYPAVAANDLLLLVVYESDLLASMVGEEVKDATPGWVHRHDYSDGDLDREANKLLA